MPAGFQVEETTAEILEELFATIQERKRDLPEGSYTASLLQSGVGRVAQKVIEEAGETALAAAQGDTESLPAEAADLLYHTLVLLAASGVSPNQVWEELRSRRR
jgi:phosphoribosyl-ATP pyrophosphohydrolase